MQTIFILGRQPALSLAELESHFGATAIRPVGQDFAIVNKDIPLDYFDQLGGSLKAGRILETLDYTDWMKISRHLTKTLPGDWQSVNGGRLTLGVSVYGLNATTKHISATALSLKKEFKQQNDVGSVRVVPNKESVLSTPQVLHNKLASSSGLEYMLIRSGTQTIIAQTNWIQDIDAYRERDQERPMRDARVGMLPPKLAQTIISLAYDPAIYKTNEPILLDPFCGTGVLLQEAALQGFKTIGTDLEPRMVEYSTKNLAWLSDLYNVRLPSTLLDVGDATKYTWPTFHTIACETYLGRPFSALPDPQTLQQVTHDVNIIHKKFFQNIAEQTKPGFRMCVAVPAWFTKSGIKHLPVLDHLEEIGYNRMSFVHAKTSDLIYHRENQVVGRELVVLIRK